jgi:hypothetical protein
MSAASLSAILCSIFSTLKPGVDLFLGTLARRRKHPRACLAERGHHRRAHAFASRPATSIGYSSRSSAAADRLKMVPD